MDDLKYQLKNILDLINSDGNVVFNIVGIRDIFGEYEELEDYSVELTPEILTGLIARL